MNSTQKSTIHIHVKNKKIINLLKLIRIFQIKFNFFFFFVNKKFNFFIKILKIKYFNYKLIIFHSHSLHASIFLFHKKINQKNKIFN